MRPDEIEKAVAALKAQGAPDEAIHAFLRENLGEPVESAPATPPPPPVAPPKEEANWGTKIAGAASSGLGMLPGGQALMAGVPMLVDRLRLKGMTGEGARTYKESLADLESAQDAAPKVLKRPVQAAALAGSMALTPLRVLQGSRAAGAAFGGAAAGTQQFLDADPTQSLPWRLGKTAMATGAGATLGAVAPWAMGHAIPRTAIGALAGGALGWDAAPKGKKMLGTATGALAGGTVLASPTKTLGALESVASKVSPQIQQAMQRLQQASGIPGVVNREMAGQQKLAAPFGVNVGERGPGAAQKIAEIENYNIKANQLWDAVEQDKTVLSDPRVIALIQDPDVAGPFRAAERIRSEAGNALPQAVTGSKTVASPILGASGTPIMNTIPVTSSVPDPSGFHLTKRILRDIVDRGFNTGSTVPIEDAIRVQPKLDQLRDLLHELSPAAREADRFMHLGKTMQEGFDRAYGAAKTGMQNPTASNLGQNDPTGIAAWVKSLTNSDPTYQRELRWAATKGARAGAKAQVAQQLAKAGPDAGRAGSLELPALKNSGEAVGQRRLALGKKGSDEYGRTIAQVDKETAEDVPMHFFMPWKARAAVEMLQVGKNPLTKPMARELLRKVSENPKAYQQILQQYGQGAEMIQQMERLMQGQIGMAVGR